MFKTIDNFICLIIGFISGLIASFVIHSFYIKVHDKLLTQEIIKLEEIKQIEERQKEGEQINEWFKNEDSYNFFYDNEYCRMFQC